MLPVSSNIIKKLQAVALFLALNFLHYAAAQTGILDSVFTFREGNIKTGSALNIITKKTGYNFTYDSRLINTEDRALFHFNRQPLLLILDSLLKNDSLNYTVIDKYIIISKALPERRAKTDSLFSSERYFITGTVNDSETGEALPFATIAIKNKGKGTVTNAGGEFGLNVTRESVTDTIVVSYLGYINREIPVEQAIGNNFRISLMREFISIPEIIIRTQVPQEIIYKSRNAVTRNYGNRPALMTGFYREGVLKKKDLQTYSEAILQIHKGSYTNSLLSDQIRIIRSRKTENTTLTDTLAVRLKAGLSSSLKLDIMKNGFDFFEPPGMTSYIYRMTDIVIKDNEPVYVIDFEQRPDIQEPLFRGTLYINTYDFALINAEFELNPAYIDKVKESFVAGPSRGFDTWPVSVKYSVSYRKVNGRYFLNHVRGDLAFNSRKKKKLFSSQFNVFFELAVTSIRTDNVARFEREELAPIHSVFSRTITDYDYLFWGDQDFLKPEENLLQALEDMKARLLEFPGE
ncbi:MAG TPA: carboxypeptidase-like regulatory domain-containing protein [Bacteroidales bacterium]|nr:carboxypeptidase-like regulatory domain-containing protein [Bacteroidales bacterium]HPF01694.1 carboxypeptidase-like regulatory domain-containing protein [Bacteroidales bacterium]HPJ58703.1 carboxypeptidase-like regulatory domain-containing protein [Bacteroidales bacterium]HPR12390.1 carboxypeptidase-like regulatory domain-containing protein [Bacteroidales bacterium]HRW84610.1 carboxypeptidase-like regulatory domain-containing protein [Bacteroidales bacterium]